MLEFVENLSAYDGLGTEGLIQNKVLQKWALVSSNRLKLSHFGFILNQIKVMVNAVSEFILNSSGIGLFMLISEDVPSWPIILPSDYRLYEPHYVITIIYDYAISLSPKVKFYLT